MESFTPHNDNPFTIEFVMYDMCNVAVEKPENRKGEVKIKCPLREGKSFEVNVRKERWNCFRKCMGCPGGGGSLDLYMLFSGVPDRKTAFREIMQYLNGDAKHAEMASRRKAEHLPPVQQTTTRLSPKIINQTYHMLLDMLTLNPEHYADLKKRGLSDDDIQDMGFKSVPQNCDELAQILAMDGAILQGVPGFYYKDNVPKMATFGSGYFIPYRNQNGEIIGLQIRYDIEIKPGLPPEMEKKLKKKRYRWFTSSHEEGGSSASNVPFWGIPKRGTSEVAYITEGGLKAATAQSLSGGYFVAIPGITCYSALDTLLDGLKKIGVTTVVDAFDSDRATNPNVARAIENIHKIALKHGYEMKSWNWGVQYKGVDDYLLARKRRARTHNST